MRIFCPAMVLGRPLLLPLLLARAGPTFSPRMERGSAWHPVHEVGRVALDLGSDARLTHTPGGARAFGGWRRARHALAPKCERAAALRATRQGCHTDVSHPRPGVGPADLPAGPPRYYLLILV